MANIVTVPDLFLLDGYLRTSDGKGDYMPIHYAQGELDGACAMHSVVMSLLYENILTREDIEKPGRSNGARLFKHLCYDFGIIKDGFFFDELTAVIEEYKTSTWRVEHFEDTPKKCIEAIKKEIDKGVAPIIGIGYGGSTDGHALLGVGYEVDDNDKITKIYCLDPGAQTPRVSVWNSYIDVFDLRRSSTYVTDNTKFEPEMCKITDLIIIENLKEIPISPLKY